MQKFIKVFLMRCSLHQANHLVSVIFFARLYYPNFLTLQALYQHLAEQLSE